MLSCVGYSGEESGFGFGLLRFDHGRPIWTSAATTATITITVSTTIKIIVEEVTNPQSTQRLIPRIDMVAFGQECYFEAFCIIVSHLTGPFIIMAGE